MSAFDMTVRPVDVQIALRDSNGGEEPNELQIGVVLGMILPFSAGPNEGPIVAPLGIIRLPMDRDMAEQVGKAILEGAEQLPKKSNLTVANSLQGVDDLNQFQQGLRS
jgi:hypothetical protein